MRMPQAALALAGLIMLWQAVVVLVEPPRYLLPSPVAVVGVFLRQPAFLAHHMMITATEVIVGLLVGSLLGFLTALFAAALPRIGQFVWPVVLVLQALPVFVLAPVLVLWFGFGLASKVVMTVIIIFFPVASAFADGLNRTDRDILDAASLTQRATGRSSPASACRSPCRRWYPASGSPRRSRPSAQSLGNGSAPLVASGSS